VQSEAQKCRKQVTPRHAFTADSSTHTASTLSISQTPSLPLPRGLTLSHSPSNTSLLIHELHQADINPTNNTRPTAPGLFLITFRFSGPETRTSHLHTDHSSVAAFRQQTILTMPTQSSTNTSLQSSSERFGLDQKDTRAILVYNHPNGLITSSEQDLCKTLDNGEHALRSIQTHRIL
jgi:hypothetical protein